MGSKFEKFKILFLFIFIFFSKKLIYSSQFLSKILQGIQKMYSNSGTKRNSMPSLCFVIRNQVTLYESFIYLRIFHWWESLLKTKQEMIKIMLINKSAWMVIKIKTYTYKNGTSREAVSSFRELFQNECRAEVKSLGKKINSIIGIIDILEYN